MSPGDLYRRPGASATLLVYRVQGEEVILLPLDLSAACIIKNGHRYSAQKDSLQAADFVGTIAPDVWHRVVRNHRRMKLKME